MARDPEIQAHLDWLGYVQPIGLVVSIPALVQAQAYVNKNIIADHQRFLACLPEDEKLEPKITDFPTFTRDVLGWDNGDLLGAPGSDPVPSDLDVALPEYGETLRPTHAVREFSDKGGNGKWIMLVQDLPSGVDIDEVNETDDRRWQATPHARFERLLRETQVPIGLLVNGKSLRVVYAPRGETSGHVTFRVADMAGVAGRPIFAALHMLLCAERLFSLPEKQRLPAILADSRKYQNVVSTQLAEQVLAALYELLRGFQAADDARKGELLRDVLRDEPDHVYAGLLTVLMRLVFVLYAEDRGLLSSHSLYANHYSVTGLFERLRSDAGRFPDTMDQRYGAWAQLLVLFRIIYDGARHDGFHIPGRKGYLFDPDRYSFLEGRPRNDRRQFGQRLDVPRVSDGVIFRVLSNLLILDGERLSYRTLDVEQIGSVYEAIMGFRLEIAEGRAIAIKPVKRHGAPATISLEALLDTRPADRAKWLKEQTDQKFDGKAADALKEGKTINDLLAALDRKIAKHVTPNVVPKGAMVLQPSDERRRSGSHYTPRSLTEPIVRKTLEPILKRLGDKPTPDQLLDLKICDPAMGSGAFLVEACRQLGDELVKAWHVHNCVPKIPPDEDELLHARRIIAQRCLYGVDKNPMAVDLAKLSLWLATLAKDHPFTFLDHALRSGDSLVGLTRKQIADFHWLPVKQRALGQEHIDDRIKRATENRQQILAARDDVPYEQLRQQLDVADEALEFVRFVGDLCVAAFFAGAKDRERKAKRDEYLGAMTDYLRSGDMRQRPTAQLDALRNPSPANPHPLSPFHWEVEFPEVFGRKEGGFDAFVGNPPFAGRTTLSEGSHSAYIDWLQALHNESHGNSDLVAHFFRRGFDLLRRGGSFGLIATNTIGQGDTRSTGLRWICVNGGTIYAARRRLKWPGQAAVVVSVVHVLRGSIKGPFELDGRLVPTISAYLFHAGGHENPQALQTNAGKSFQGCVVVGMGFTFDDTDTKGVASPISEMHRLVKKNPRNAERIFPYIGGEEISTDRAQTHHRFVINFEDFTEQRARDEWPDLIRIVEEKVKPVRTNKSGSWSLDKQKRAEKWWQFSRTAKDLYIAIDGLQRVIAVSRVGNAFAFCFLPARMVFSERLVVFPFESLAAFSSLQTRVHEVWVRCFSSTLKDDLMYAPTDCFDNFPFAEHFEDQAALQTAGGQYYDVRSGLMIRSNEGLTKTYNRFHDPGETSSDIARLRELHAAMDRAVLDAYGWEDIPTDCGFALDYLDIEDEDDLPPAARDRIASGDLFFPDAASATAFTAAVATGRRRLPWRYRWPDEIRDEVLARLLALNAKRAEQERLSGAAAATTRVVRKPKKVAAAAAAQTELALFERAYPATDADRAICAASLAAVEQTGGLGSMEHLDMLLLAAHPEWCKAFLKSPHKKSLDKAMKRAPALLFVGTESIKWKESRDYLEKRNAILVDRAGQGQRITAGTQLLAVKAEFPDGVSEVVALAIVAQRELQSLRKNAARATKAQKQVLSMFQEQAAAAGLAVA